jgi:hypothetical protein
MTGIFASIVFKTALTKTIKRKMQPGPPETGVPGLLVSFAPSVRNAFSAFL